MNLYEFEGKSLFQKYAIPIPSGTLITSHESGSPIAFPIILKAQVLSGGRGKKGLVIPVHSAAEFKDGLEHLEKAGISKILAEEFIENKTAEYYLAVTYDTGSRTPVCLFSTKGGVEIESQNGVASISINPLKPLSEQNLNLFFSDSSLPADQVRSLCELVTKLYSLFIDFDARLVEINPLLLTTENIFIAADAKIILDDDALFRHEDLGFEPRNEIGNQPTKSELEAKEIDKDDHRGSAGTSYIELDGDIAILAAGGGGSLVNMDTLVTLGGKPANYTEHSGNPPAEKIEKLTRVILAKPGLNGCWVVGATANFTDIYETMSGFLAGLRTIVPKPDYPIVIRRGGPRYEEAFEMLKSAAQKEGYDIHVYGPETPMTSTAKILLDFVDAYKKKERNKTP